MRDIILVLLASNLLFLFIYILYIAVEYSLLYIPLWKIVWDKAPLNLAGKIIASVLLGITFLPCDICLFTIILLVRIFRHIGYAFWWAFAEDRQDVLERWSEFWKNKDIYKFWRGIEL